jgi:hypothetical protein
MISDLGFPSIRLEYTRGAKWRASHYSVGSPRPPLMIGKVAQVEEAEGQDHSDRSRVRDMVTCGVFQLSMTESDWALIVG